MRLRRIESILKVAAVLVALAGLFMMCGCATTAKRYSYTDRHGNEVDVVKISTDGSAEWADGTKIKGGTQRPSAGTFTFPIKDLNLLNIGVNQ